MTNIININLHINISININNYYYHYYVYYIQCDKCAYFDFSSKKSITVYLSNGRLIGK